MKREKYLEHSCEDFFFFNLGEIFDCEAEVYFKRFATMVILLKKWDSTYSHACTFLYQGKNANMHNEICKFMHTCVDLEQNGGELLIMQPTH